MDNVAIFLVLGAALAWGTSQTVTKLGLARMDLVSYAAVRAGAGLTFILAYGIATHQFQFPRLSLVGMAAFAGLIDSFLGTLLYMFAIKQADAHVAATLSNTAPFWGVVTAVTFLHEPARVITFIAALLVVAGAYFLISPARTDPHPQSVLRGLSALGAAILWGVAETGPAKYCLDQGMTPITFQLVLVGTAAVAWWTVSAVTYPRRQRYHRPVGVWNAVFTAFSGFFLGWILWLSGLRLGEASLLTPIRGGGMTLFAFFISIAFLHERPTGRAALGALLSSVGVVIVSFAGHG